MVSLVQGQENVAVKESHFGTVAAETHLLMGSVKVQAVMIVVVGMKGKQEVEQTGKDEIVEGGGS